MRPVSAVACVRGQTDELFVSLESIESHRVVVAMPLQGTEGEIDRRLPCTRRINLLRTHILKAHFGFEIVSVNRHIRAPRVCDR
jgi:hypothetical protein